MKQEFGEDPRPDIPDTMRIATLRPEEGEESKADMSDSMRIAALKRELGEDSRSGMSDTTRIAALNNNDEQQLDGPLTKKARRDDDIVKVEDASMLGEAKHETHDDRSPGLEDIGVIPVPVPTPGADNSLETTAFENVTIENNIADVHQALDAIKVETPMVETMKTDTVSNGELEAAVAAEHTASEEPTECKEREVRDEAFAPGKARDIKSPKVVSVSESKAKTNDVQKESVTPNTAENLKRSKGRRLTFPEKLMALLNSEEYRESMCWLPHGNAFSLNQPIFVKETLPNHFEGTKFESFTRKLNRWGFKRIAGEDAKHETFAYAHHLFKRDVPELCRGMSGGKKIEQDFSHLIRYREGERLMNPPLANPATLATLGFAGVTGVPGLGMQPGFGQQPDLQRMLLERQRAVSGGIGGNPYGSFAGAGGGFGRELAVREMMLRQDAANGQNANAVLFQQQQQQQQQQFACFVQSAVPGQMQMNQMQMAQMTQMMINHTARSGVAQAPDPLDAAIMAGGAGVMNFPGGAAQMAAPMMAQQQQQNSADLKMLQEQRLRIQQQVAMQKAGAAGVMNPAFTNVSSGATGQFGV